MFLVIEDKFMQLLTINKVTKVFGRIDKENATISKTYILWQKEIFDFNLKRK